MEAHIGDQVVVEGTRVGQPRRSGEVLEILCGAEITVARPRAKP